MPLQLRLIGSNANPSAVGTHSSASTGSHPPQARSPDPVQATAAPSRHCDGGGSRVQPSRKPYLESSVRPRGACPEPSAFESPLDCGPVAHAAVRNRAARKHEPTRSDRTRPNDDCHPDRILLEYAIRSLDDHCSGAVRTRALLDEPYGERPLEDEGKSGELVGTDSEPASRQRLYSPVRKKGAGRIPSDACARCAATLAGV